VEKFKLLFFISINIFSFLLMGYDKMQAKRNRWRIKEKTLLFLALAGGAIGGYCGMQVFRHKTKHNLFRFGLPLLVLLNLYLFYTLGGVEGEFLHYGK